MSITKKAIYASLLVSCGVFALGFAPGVSARAAASAAFAFLAATLIVIAGFVPGDAPREEGPRAVSEADSGPSPEALAADLEKAVAERDEALSRLESLGRSVSFASESLVPDVLAYLPLASAVIRAVPEKTEEAAFVVMDKFSVVKEAAKAAADSARDLRRDLEDENSGKSIRREADLSRKTVLDEKSVIGELRSCTKENHEQLLAMGKEIETGLDLLKSIEDITARSKLIAFNMSVEAARIGEKGAGFKVIILELHKLNDRTLDFSRKVTALMRKFREYNETLVNNMDVKAGAVVDSVERGINAAQGAVETLIAASVRTEEFTKEIAVMSESINRDMDGVLESLQFQDITRQMMEGADGIIADLKERIERGLDEAGLAVDRPTVDSRFSEARERFVREAKTRGEKGALLEVRL